MCIRDRHSECKCNHRNWVGCIPVLQEHSKLPMASPRAALSGNISLLVTFLVFYLPATCHRPPQPISGKRFTYMPLGLDYIVRHLTCRKCRLSIDRGSTNSDTASKWECVSKPGVNMARADNFRTRNSNNCTKIPSAAGA